MSIIVTGATGFLGSKIDAALGDIAIAISRTATSFDNHYAADLTDPAQIPELLNKLSNFKIDGLVHCAAVTPWSPNPDYSLDLKMAANVVELCNALKIPNLVFISGWVVYDMTGPAPYVETTKLESASDYGKSKIKVEKFLKDNLKDTNLINLRVASIYGPGQTSAGLIPNLVKSAFVDGKIKINSKTTKRDYLYIDDFVGAVLSSLEVNESIDLNIGGGRSQSVEGVAKTIQSIFRESVSTEVEIDISQPVQEGVPADNQLDITKALDLNILSRPTDFKSGLLNYAKWVKHENNF